MDERRDARTGPPLDVLALVGHDLLLVCDADGLISWANESAERTLGAHRFRPFSELVPPYAVSKAMRFLTEARQHQTDMWEMIFASDDDLLILALYGAPYDGGAVVAATRLPQGYLAMHQQLSTALNETATLHREAVRRSHELAATYAHLQEANKHLAEQARLEGVILAARELAHVLNNDLTVPVGLVDVLLEETDLPLRVATPLQAIAEGLESALQHIDQFRQVLRVSIKETPVGPALDLERSTQHDVRPA